MVVCVNFLVFICASPRVHLQYVSSGHACSLQVAGMQVELSICS